MKKHLWTLIIPILLLASVLRLYRLDSVPPSPYWEEVALGYDAYSIAKTGKDHHGNAYPIIAFPSYGDFKPSGYFYAIVPFVQLFGLSVLAIRLPSALAGIITVGLLYLIGKEIRDQETGLVAAFVLAISPWAIQFSRGGWEVNLAMTLILAGATLLLYARKRPWLLLGSVICFALSMYTYHAARLFAPMVGGLGGLALTVYYFRHNRKGLYAVAVAFATTLVMVGPLVLNLNNKSVSSRFTDTSIFSNPQPVLDSNAAIAAHGGSRLSKLIYHRYWYYGAIVLQQWASHFSPTFLFVRGDGNYRHGGWTGLQYPVEGAFIGVTLFVLILQSLQKISNFKFQISKDQKLSAEYWGLIGCIIWICLAAVPPALVTPAPHALRDLFAVPAYAILIAVGIVTVVKLFPIRYRRYVIGLIAAGYLFFGTSYFSQYLTIYPVKAQSDWQYGYESLFSQLNTYTVPNEQVYVSRAFGRPAMYYLFYSHYDPRHVQEIEPALLKDQLELLRVDDYHFVDGIPDGSGIFAMPTGTIVLGGKIIGTVDGLDGLGIWTIWRK